jgi:hypothetical protein
LFSLNGFPNPSLDVTVKLALHTPTFKVAGAESKVNAVAVRVTAIVDVPLETIGSLTAKEEVMTLELVFILVTLKERLPVVVLFAGILIEVVSLTQSFPV